MSYLHCDSIDRIPWGRDPLGAVGNEVQLYHIDHIEVNHVEHLHRLVHRGGANIRPIRIHGQAVDGEQMTPEVLDELYALLPLLPELHVAVYTRSDEEVRPRSDYQLCYDVPVHVALLIALAAR